MVFHIAVCSPDAALRSGLERQCMELFCPAAGCVHRAAAAGCRCAAAPGHRRENGLTCISSNVGAVAGPGRAFGGCGAAPPGPQGSAGLCGPHTGPRLQRFPGGCHAVFASAGAPAGAFGPACPRHRAGVRPGNDRCHRRRPAGAGLCADRISGVHPPHRALPPHQRGGRAHPVAAGAVFCGGTASAGGWALLQPHRSYVVNLAEADLLSAGELRMRSGARISIPRGREGAVRDAFQQWVQQQKYSLK